MLSGRFKMKMKKRIFVLLLAALLLACAACGETDGSPFHTLEVLGARQYGLICRKDDRLAPLVFAAIENLARDGTLSAASTRWIGRDKITLKPQPAGSVEDAAAEEVPPRTLIVGVERDFEPLAFFENGILQGMSVDIADGLGRALGWEVAYQPISSGEVGTQLASGNIDVALGFDPGTVNAEKYSLGPVYMESEIVLAVRRESGMTRWKDLEDQKIGLVDDPTVTACLKASEQAGRYAAGAVIYASPARCLLALDDGKCAALAMDKLMLDRLQ